MASTSVLTRRMLSITEDSNKSLVVLTLNRPKYLNALNLDLVTQLYSELLNCQADDDIVCVVLHGAGDKAFCAGGDIKEMYRSVHKDLGDNCKTADSFFNQEYRLDYLIHSFKKPVVTWGHGIVMGGGLGLMQASSHRIVTPQCIFAMPEVAIALYPDVGANYFLNKISQPWGRFLALTGACCNAAESMILGLADVLLNGSDFDALIQRLQSASWDDDHHNTVATVINDLALITDLSSSPSSRLNEVAEQVNQLFVEPSLVTLTEQVANLSSNPGLHPWLQEAFNGLLKASPFALCCADQALQRNLKQDLLSVFKFDLIYSTNMIRQPDFVEGVRAQVIDKDKKPRWKHHCIEDVPAELFQSMIEMPWDKHPFDDLG